jgi:hypothetical protein
MSGVVLVLRSWKRCPLRLRVVPPAGSSLLTAAASPSLQALYSAWAGMFFGMIRRLARIVGVERFGGSGSEAIARQVNLGSS